MSSRLRPEPTVSREGKIGRIGQRMRQNHHAQFSYSEELIEIIAHRCHEVESGARNVDHILTRTLLPELSQEILGRMTRHELLNKVDVTINDQGSFQYSLE